MGMRGELISRRDCARPGPPPSKGWKFNQWMVGWMFQVEVYLRVRRAVMVEGMSIREASRVFGLHRDTVRKMVAYSVPPG